MRVLTEEDGEPFTLFYNGENIEKDLYEDEDKFASLEVTRNENGLHMKGFVGPQHRIAPIPISGRLLSGIIPHGLYEIAQDERLDKVAFNESKPEIRMLSRGINFNKEKSPDPKKVIGPVEGAIRLLDSEVEDEVQATRAGILSRIRKKKC
ncbi:hypothetical protein V5799_010424 [Amblyomma americanum]|uniref:Uncharacterized protein n=1 Tax=Amblyomma americanum TaxID=6943 RepID=A0AAQ4EJV3_AMBAM